MVIVSPILERDEEHGDILANTTGNATFILEDIILSNMILQNNKVLLMLLMKLRY